MARRPPPTIVVDGITYVIPPFLRECPNDIIIKTIRAWKPAKETSQ